MAFSEHKITAFTNQISALADQPNMQPDELKAYFDSSPEELRQAHNGLCDALAAATAAADIGFAQTAGVPESTVQDAIENVQAQVTAAIVGSIPSGSIDGDKLAQDVRTRLSNIESSVLAETSARSSGDSNLQSQISTHSTQIAAKCEIVLGSYTGDHTAQRTINLGFTPKAVLVLREGNTLGNGSDKYGGLAFANHDVTFNNNIALRIVTNGFQVGQADDHVYTNWSGDEYFYLAFK